MVLPRPETTSDFRVSGTVAALFVKPARRQPMAPQNAIDLRKRMGIVGDCQANPLGPRQVLLIDRAAMDDHELTLDSLRGNIIVDGFQLDALASGTVLRVGQAAGPQIRLTHRCEVCRQVTDAGGPAVARALVGRRGYLGVVLDGGTLAVGDSIHVGATGYPEVPDELYERFVWVCEQIPYGTVCSFATLVVLIGASRSYLRALPRWIRRGHVEGRPVHRLLSSSGAVLPYISDHAERLLTEGVEVINGSVLLDAFAWDARALYCAEAPRGRHRRAVA
jgi:alkylated DNA nucleotide flippase Atl1